MLKGQAKTDYQREYMRSYRSNRGLTRSNKSGLTADNGSNGSNKPETIDQVPFPSTQTVEKVSGVGGNSKLLIELPFSKQAQVRGLK